MISTLARGAASGALATAAMSGVMLAGQKTGLMPGQPPKHIVRALLPGHKRRPKAGERPLAVLAHLGFGATAGAVFGLLTRRVQARLRLGVAYGLLIWAGSYQGWLPALNILPPASRDPRPGRPLVMAAAHAVYGAALAAALRRSARGAGRR